jgi:hypothetical protein
MPTADEMNGLCESMNLDKESLRIKKGRDWILKSEQKVPYLLVPLLISISILSTLSSSQSSFAEDLAKKRLVVIDTGIDSRLPNFEKHIVYEVCLMFWYSCPNGLDYQEGRGSATLSTALLTYPAFEHGTQMARVAVLTNPEIEIVFMRIIGNNSRGARLLTSDNTVENALDWVIKNAVKHNVGAVAMSQGHHNFSGSIRYCPSMPSTEKKIQTLKQMNIPVFLPTGNSADKSRIDWPACIPSAIAMGSVDSKNQISKFSNMDRNLTDFYALGEIKDVHPDGITRNYSGTSVSVQVAAAGWIEINNRFPSMSYSEIYAQVRKSGPIVFDQELRFGRKFDSDLALQSLGQG